MATPLDGQVLTAIDQAIIPSSRVFTTNSQLLAANDQALTTDSQLLTTNSEVPTANSQVLIGNNQVLTSNRQVLTAKGPYGNVFLQHKTPTDEFLIQYLRIDKEQLLRIKLNVVDNLNDYGLAGYDTNLAFKQHATKARELTAYVIRSQSASCKFGSHPDPSLVEACIYELIRQHMNKVKKGVRRERKKSARMQSRSGVTNGDQPRLQPALQPPSVAPTSAMSPADSSSSHPASFSHAMLQLGHCTIMAGRPGSNQSFWSPLSFYLKRSNEPVPYIQCRDLDYSAWLATMKLRLRFDDTSEVIIYNSIAGEAIEIRNEEEWVSAILESVANGMLRTKFTIEKDLHHSNSPVTESTS
jgi:hypothetical protein